MCIMILLLHMFILIIYRQYFNSTYIIFIHLNLFIFLLSLVVFIHFVINSYLSISTNYNVLFVLFFNKQKMFVAIVEKFQLRGKEDPLEQPYVILIHNHDYECQLSNQTRKKLFRDKLNEWIYESFLIFEKNIA